jgi:hypothetical protein
MQLSPYEIALIAGGFTIAGALVGSLVTYWLASRLATVNARRDAGRRLREAFAPELAALDPATSSKELNVEGLLGAAWPKHRAAVFELAFHLPQHQREGLERAWREYYFDAGGKTRFYDYYIGENARDKFRERVNAILRFTQI